jgi:hypothetical protein
MEKYFLCQYFMSCVLADDFDGTHQELKLWVPLSSVSNLFYNLISESQVSVVGMQVGKEIQPYRTFSGNEILMLRHGRLTVEEMFLEERAHNQWMTWAYRGLGWLMMFLGANCVSNILQLIGKFIISRILNCEITWNSMSDIKLCFLIGSYNVFEMIIVRCE